MTSKSFRFLCTVSLLSMSIYATGQDLGISDIDKFLLKACPYSMQTFDGWSDAQIEESLQTILDSTITPYITAYISSLSPEDGRAFRENNMRLMNYISGMFSMNLYVKNIKGSYTMEMSASQKQFKKTWPMTWFLSQYADKLISAWALYDQPDSEYYHVKYDKQLGRMTKQE